MRGVNLAGAAVKWTIFADNDFPVTIGLETAIRRRVQPIAAGLKGGRAELSDGDYEPT